MILPEPIHEKRRLDRCIIFEGEQTGNKSEGGSCPVPATHSLSIIQVAGCHQPILRQSTAMGSRGCAQGAAHKLRGGEEDERGRQNRHGRVKAKWAEQSRDSTSGSRNTHHEPGKKKNPQNTKHDEEDEAKAIQVDLWNLLSSPQNGCSGWFMHGSTTNGRMLTPASFTYQSAEWMWVCVSGLAPVRMLGEVTYW
ncbi:uncharacterized protein BO72DRAFT_38877 [Aspergillus fijiensis CBS 313.89]|uniref:Uncharacterized protein n=1 Tax=Aspergillus fijiensis CBS 313.89 TaxID=1448319 RepID=A0A8G1REN4_9EURO|nr:uncharacterized protein BO72DRAFT_38877 [Aspergillus fijiensis CBS 313.89]RAK70962.1 hypothetical protein BO72DRAFT_38877 [Aspergillus fijiensis CBS 313.89]